MSELKSTLRVTNEADVKSLPGIVEGQTVKMMLGDDKHPSERVRVVLASFEPGTYEHLHWHLIEASYYVISGRAVMKDIEGKNYYSGPGSFVYAPPGIAGSHSWDIKEPLQLISVRGTNDPEKTIQFSVDESSKESRIELDYLLDRNGAQFKSLY